MYRKTFFGSLTAFILGTSCCWISSLAIWIGGTAMATFISNYMGGIQLVMITTGLFLAILSLLLYLKNRKEKI